MEPAKVVLVDNRPGVHQEGKHENGEETSTNNKHQNVVFGGHALDLQESCMQLTYFHIDTVLIFLPVFLSCLSFFGLVIGSLLNFLKLSFADFLHGFNFVNIYFLIDV